MFNMEVIGKIKGHQHHHDSTQGSRDLQDQKFILKFVVLASELHPMVFYILESQI